MSALSCLTLSKRELEDYSQECHILRLRVPTNLTKEQAEIWLNACCRHKAIDFLRKEKQRREHEIPLNSLEIEHESQTPKCECSAICSELSTHLKKAISKLTPNQQEILLLYHFEEKTIAEIAEETGRTPNAIKESLSHARKRLRHLLEESGFDEQELAEYLYEIERSRRGG